MKKLKPLEEIGSGALTLKLRRYADGRFGYDLKPPGGERKKVRLDDLDEARERALRDIQQAAGGNLNRLNITEDEFVEFMQWKASRKQALLVTALVPMFLADKLRLLQEEELSEKHVRDLRSTLDRFQRAFQRPVGSIDRAEVESWLYSQEVGPRRWNNMLTHVIALIRYARAHKLIGAELTAIESIPRRKVTTKKETYTPAEMEKLLRAVPQEWLPAIVLGGFCGIRPEEICPETKSHKPPLTWTAFLWDRRKIDVPAAVAKDGRRRFVPLCDAALAFLAPWRNASGPVVPRMRLCNMTSRWAKAAGVTWKFDALRHSYASYRLAILQDIPALTLEMGNSAKMIHDHYLDLKHEDEALAWFALRPSTPGNVIALAI